MLNKFIKTTLLLFYVFSLSLNAFDLSQESTESFPEAYADNWIKQIRSGNDDIRTYAHDPAVLSILPDIESQEGLDIGCGEGYYTRLLADQGAVMTGIDISHTLIKAATDFNNQPISYQTANAVSLPFEESQFDFATSFFSFIELADLDKAVSEASRVIKKDGFFLLSITHPAFWSNAMEWIFDENGKREALICQNYFKGEKGQIVNWDIENDNQQQKRFEQLNIAFFRRTFSTWINTLIKHGFVIEEIQEPKLQADVVANSPSLEGVQIVPFSMIIKCRKAH